MEGHSSPSCTGACSAGYACGPGSTNDKVAACTPGRYSTAGAASCTECAPGLFGGASALATASCSGNCTAGYACGPGSTNATALMCGPGSYSYSGAGVCTPCPVGRFGGSMGLTNGSCSGPCSAGYACPSGSTNSTPVQCAPGTFSELGVGICSPCPAGRYGSTSGLPTPGCSGPCDAGEAGVPTAHAAVLCCAVLCCGCVVAVLCCAVQE